MTKSICRFFTLLIFITVLYGNLANNINMFFNNKFGTHMTVKKNKIFLYMIPDGLLKSYYESGELQSQAYYKNNLKDGDAKYFYENGKLMLESYFEKDLAEGVSKKYYEDGRLRNEVIYKAGIKQQKKMSLVI